MIFGFTLKIKLHKGDSSKSSESSEKLLEDKKKKNPKILQDRDTSTYPIIRYLNCNKGFIKML